MTATVTVGDDDLRRALRNLQFAISDMTPAMADIAGAMQETAEDSFDTETEPGGKKWAALARSTQADRAKKNYGPQGPILQRTGRLAGSIVAEWDRDSARAGTNVVYATTQFFGAKRGAFGTTSKGRPIPWGDIPGRPFLGLNDEQASDFLSRIHQHVLRSF